MELDVGFLDLEQMYHGIILMKVLKPNGRAWERSIASKHFRFVSFVDGSSA